MVDKMQARLDELKQLKQKAEALKSIWQSGFADLQTAISQTGDAKREHNQSYVHSAVAGVLAETSNAANNKGRGYDALATMVNGLNKIITDYEKLEDDLRNKPVVAYVPPAMAHVVNTVSVVATNAQTINQAQNWDEKLGQTVANITDSGAYTEYYGSGNMSANGGFDGQCTWYAYGRFYEVTGIQLNSAPHAKNWLNANANDSRVTVTNGADTVSAGSIAVRTGGDYGHVMFVENVERNSDGSPAYVYFTECNGDNNGQYDPGRDCLLQKMSYSDFVAKKNPAGFIKPAE